ncbi:MULTISPECIES: hypothetical protein [unclassified Gilliamella]|jgi:hypothetical protein|nr:hypothetical protein [Gilliamella apicola]KDN10693.1 hypothetical protein GAPWKB30_0662 [Gilliamella apicola]
MASKPNAGNCVDVKKINKIEAIVKTETLFVTIGFIDKIAAE